jgi:hypothetical protein
MGLFVPTAASRPPGPIHPLLTCENEGFWSGEMGDFSLMFFFEHQGEV